MIIGNGLVQGALRVIGDIYGNIVGTVNGHNVLTDVPTILDHMVANFSFDNDCAEYKSERTITSSSPTVGYGTQTTTTVNNYLANDHLVKLTQNITETNDNGSTINTYSATLQATNLFLTSSNSDSDIERIVSLDTINFLMRNGSHYSTIQSNGITVCSGINDYSGLTSTTIYENGASLQSKYLGIGAAVSGYNCISVNGSTDVWLRIPQKGLIPYAADATNGDGNLGTETYPFKNTYTKTLIGNNATFSGTVTITKTADAEATHDYKPALIVGGTTAQAHLELDGNEIMAKGSATTTGTLTLNNNGGAVNVGPGGIGTTGNITISKSTLVDAGLFCENSSVKGTFYVSSGGNLGIYNRTQDRWCLRDSGTFVDSIAVFRCYNEGYTTLRPTIGTNSGTNAMSVIVSNSSTVGFYGRWGGGASASFSGRTISCPSSDIRLKENISPTREKALDIINKIPMYEFDWKNKDLGHQKLGFVVDHMEKIDPKFSIGGEDDTEENPSYKSVNTFYLQGYEVKAIQELSEENENLKKTIQSLEERITLLEKAVTR